MASELNKKEMAASVAVMRDDVLQLTDDFVDVIRHFGKKGRSFFWANQKRLTNLFNVLRKDITKRSAIAYGKIAKTSRIAAQRSREQVKERPFVSVFSALAAGIVVGALIRRR